MKDNHPTNYVLIDYENVQPQNLELLSKHLKARKIHIQREKDLAEVPILRMDSAANRDEKIAAIVKNLSGQGPARPRKEKTLTNAINSWFTKQLDEKELNALIQSLKRKGYITVKEGNISYNLTQTP